MNYTWANFFAASAGASATLAGLVAVALSVNLNLILQGRHLPARAGATISALLLILITSLAGLLPQRTPAFGAEVLGFSALALLPQIRSTRFSFRARIELNRPAYESLLQASLNLIQTVPFYVGSALLIAGRSHGLYWLAAGFIAAFIVAVFNSWVLLVEIAR